MISNERIAANRRNSQKSTGPRTAAGKSIVAQNAIRHGLLSKQSLLTSETEADLVEFGKRMRGRLAPEGELELLLVDRIVSSAWRLRRVVHAEAALLDTEPNIAAAFRGYTGKYLERVSRYETTIERGLYRALQELRQLQADRNEIEVAPASDGTKTQALG